MQNKEETPAKKRLNPFIEFFPREKDVRDTQGDGPPNPSQGADTLRPNSRPADRTAKKPILKEDFDLNQAIQRYLHKRRMNWVYRIDESTNIGCFVTMLEDFASYAAAYLNLSTVPPINLIPPDANTFATWSPTGIDLSVSNRHPMDVFRSLAHELVHHKQHEDDELHTESGVTGSEHENEANALAGIMMRNYAKAHPELFELEAISEGFLKTLLFGSGKKSSQSSQRAPTHVKSAVNKSAAKASVQAPLSSSDKESVASAVHKMEIKQAAKTQFKKQSQRYINPEKGNLEDRIQAAAARLMRQQGRKENPNYQQDQEAAAAKRVADAEQHHKDWLANNKKFPMRKSAPGKKPFSDIIRGLKESLSLLAKANKSGIPYGVLSEVYDRGIESWTKDTYLSPTQFAFNRVNSFIAGGKARELDGDIYEAASIIPAVIDALGNPDLHLLAVTTLGTYLPLALIGKWAERKDKATKHEIARRMANASPAMKQQMNKFLDSIPPNARPTTTPQRPRIKRFHGVFHEAKGDKNDR